MCGRIVSFRNTRRFVPPMVKSCGGSQRRSFRGLRTFAISRRTKRPSFAKARPRETEGAGKARPRPRPVARLRKECRRQVPQVPAGRPGLPCAMGLRLIRDLLGAPGFLATVIRAMPSHRKAMSRSIVTNLISASGYQDHTTSPSATSPVVLRKAPDVVAAIASRTPRIVTTRTPLLKSAGRGRRSS